MQITNDVKIIGGIVIATLVLIVGAIFLFGRDSTSSTDSTGKVVKVSNDILLKNAIETDGPSDAKVTIVEFGDFQCPACKAEESIIDQVRKDYQGKVRFVWRNFPLTQVHEFAFDSSLAAEAAGKQGKFWPYHDKLFEISPSLAKDKLLQAAKDVGLDTEKFTKDMDSDAVRQIVLNDQADGNKANVNGTPTIFINQYLLVNQANPNSLPTLSDFKATIDPLLK